MSGNSSIIKIWKE